MNNKNIENNLLSIKEFSEFVGISTSSLRHYDNKGIFKPVQKDNKFKNNYRYYTPTQIMTVKMIRVLTEIGVSLDTIKELAKNRTPEIILKLLRKHRDIAAEKLRFWKEAHSIINTFTELIYESISITETEITISVMPEKRIILGKINDYQNESGYVKTLMRFCNAPHEPKLNMSYPVGGYWKNMPTFLDEPSRPTRFYSLDPKGYEKKEEGLYLIGYTRGYYGVVNNLPKQMKSFAKKHGLVFNGPVYTIYLSDEISLTDKNQYLLQVTASVKEAGHIQPVRTRKLK
jgi:DNA-binding transcriptional MerR regulator